MCERGVPLVECGSLVKAYRTGGVFGSAGAESWFRAVDRVDLAVFPGESLALVGESGCGKSTTGRLLLGLERPSSGRVSFEGRDLAGLSASGMRRLRARMQMVFQDPLGSLNPRFTVRRTLAEPLRIHSDLSGAALEDRVRELLELVGLAPEHAGRYPHEFSGGQRQRVAIARAIATGPSFIVADEPVSALDISIQGQIIGLLQHLRRRFGLAVLFISHDLALVRAVCERVAVMFRGRLVELAPTGQLFAEPLHPYTRLLIDSAGIRTGSLREDAGGDTRALREREQKQRALLSGAVPDLREVSPGRYAAL